LRKQDDNLLELSSLFGCRATRQPSPVLRQQESSLGHRTTPPSGSALSPAQEILIRDGGKTPDEAEDGGAYPWREKLNALAQPGASSGDRIRVEPVNEGCVRAATHRTARTHTTWIWLRCAARSQCTVAAVTANRRPGRSPIPP